METKVCVRCKEEKTVDQFSKSRAAKDGLQTGCKACNKITNAKFRDKRPAYQNKYYKTEKGKKNKLKALNKMWDSEGSGIYKIVNKETGCIYIGSTLQLARRRIEWATYLGNPDQHKRYFSDKMLEDTKRYGADAFEWTPLEKMVKNKKEITTREYEIIKVLSAAGVDIYNVLGI